MQHLKEMSATDFLHILKFLPRNVAEGILCFTQYLQNVVFIFITLCGVFYSLRFSLLYFIVMNCFS